MAEVPRKIAFYPNMVDMGSDGHFVHQEATSWFHQWKDEGITKNMKHCCLRTDFATPSRILFE